MKKGIVQKTGKNNQVCFSLSLWTENFFCQNRNLQKKKFALNRSNYIRAKTDHTKIGHKFYVDNGQHKMPFCQPSSHEKGQVGKKGCLLHRYCLSLALTLLPIMIIFVISNWVKITFNPISTWCMADKTTYFCEIFRQSTLWCNFLKRLVTCKIFRSSSWLNSSQVLKKKKLAWATFCIE